jgi:hypothetical protein
MIRSQRYNQTTLDERLEGKRYKKALIGIVAKGYIICFKMTFRCIPQENMRWKVEVLYAPPPQTCSHPQLSPVRCQTERRPSMHTNPNPNPCPRTQCNMPPQQNMNGLNTCPSHHICKEKKKKKENDSHFPLRIMQVNDSSTASRGRYSWVDVRTHSVHSSAEADDPCPCPLYSHIPLQLHDSSHTNTDLLDSGLHTHSSTHSSHSRSSATRCAHASSHPCTNSPASR